LGDEKQEEEEERKRMRKAVGEYHIMLSKSTSPTISKRGLIVGPLSVLPLPRGGSLDEGTLED